jgi:hypothetical protein
MDTQTRIYIANLGKYNEGELVGEWIALPFDEEEIHNLFVKIGVGYKDESGEYHHGLYENGCWYEEYAIHDFESALNSFNPSEYDDIFELSEQIERIEKLDSIEIEVYNAMRENGLEFEDAMEKINDGDYIWYDGCSDMVMSHDNMLMKSGFLTVS